MYVIKRMDTPYLTLGGQVWNEIDLELHSYTCFVSSEAMNIGTQLSLPVV